MNLHNVIKAPLITEKTEYLKDGPQKSVRLVFKVEMAANKELVRQALHKIYNVNAVKVNMLVVPGKNKRFGQHKSRASSWKKAIVTLAPGESIDFTK